ncbi:MAG: beta strand repeat-containing protein [Thermoguttaceae bacterium]
MILSQAFKRSASLLFRAEGPGPHRRSNPRTGRAPHKRRAALRGHIEQLESRTLLSGLSAYVQQAKLTASGGAADNDFGNAVAVSGNTMVVGAYEAAVGGNAHQGAAYVFTESGSVWTETAKLTASDGAASNFFGDSVAISGDTVVVGAPDATVGSNSDQGAAYVFTESGSVWIQDAKLTASDGAASALFGYSVAISGDGTVVVGARLATVGVTAKQGTAYVFTDPSGGWASVSQPTTQPMTQTAELTASDGAADDQFGNSVAIDSETDTVVVGAFGATVDGNSGQGAAYVFAEPVSGWANMNQTAELTSSYGAASGTFGKSVAISGDTVVVGAYWATVGGNSEQGAAFVFVEPGSTWANMTQTAELTASDGAANDQFGNSVAIDSETDTVVVGAYNATVGGNFEQGAAYVFVEPSSGWSEDLNTPPTLTQTAKLTASDGAAGNWFGMSVGISDDTVVVGAPEATVGGNAYQGAAYVFGSAPLGFSVTGLAPDTVGVAYNQTIAALGGTGTVTLSVSNLQNAIPGLTLVNNGNGSLTISGTPTAAGNETFTVKATDSATPPNTASVNYSIWVNPAVTLSPTLPAGAENVNYIQEITASGGTGNKIVAVSNVTNAIPGLTVEAVNPNNVLITGAPTATGTETFTVTATDTIGATATANYSITITPTVVQQAKLTASAGAANSGFGDSVAVSGNTMVVGAPDATVGGNTDQGAAYVFTESASGWTQVAKLTESKGAAGDDFGNSVSISGNTVVVGAWHATVGSNADQGAAYVFTEPGSGWANMTQTAKLTASGGAANNQFGSSVSISGNTVVVGAWYASVGANAYQGAAYVFTEPGSGWANMTQTAKLTASDGAAQDQFGLSASISGNTVVVGAWNAKVGGNSQQGAAYVFTEPGSGWVNMTQTAKLTASDGAAENYFGFSVSISGKTVVAGAEGATVGGNSQQGAAYVFTEPGSDWANMTQTAKLTGSDGSLGTFFGNSVSISGNMVVVGSPWTTVNQNVDRGAAFVFTEPGSGWANMVQTACLIASDGAASNYFGSSVAISGGTLVVGAPDATVGSNSDQGAAYVFNEIELAPATLPADTVNVAYNQTITASGGIAPVTLTVTNITGAINGLTVPASGTGSLAISGTPTAAGTETFTVTAADPAGDTGSATYSITVNPAVTLAPATLPADTINVAYKQTITASGGTGTVTLAVSNISGAITGLTVPSSGTGSLAISGTPTAAGTETFTVTATDSVGGTTSTTYSILVNPAVTLTPATLPAGTENVAYNQTITAGGGTGTITLAVSSIKSAISGLTVPASGTGSLTISGTPTKTGTETFIVTATDSVGGTATTNYSITVAAAKNGAMMVSQAAATAPPLESGNSSVITQPVTTSSNGAGDAVGTKLKLASDPVASVPIGKTPGSKLVPARRNRTVSALSDKEAADLAVVDFDGTGLDDALLSAVAAGRKR